MAFPSTKASMQRMRARQLGLTEHFTDQEWEQLCQQYEGKCLNCGDSDNLQPDHIIALSKGGPNTIDNIQPLCGKCNYEKRAKTIDYRPGNQPLAKIIVKPPTWYIEQQFTVSEVAQTLHKSTHIIRRWIKTGKIRAARPGNSYLIAKSEVEKFGVELKDED